jgi:hypothetical protein
MAMWQAATSATQEQKRNLIMTPDEDILQIP